MKIAKSLVLTLSSLLVLPTISCSRHDDPDSKYKITEKEYNEQFDRDYVLLKSNYAIKEKYNSFSYTILFDNGNIKLDYSDSDDFYYELTLENDTYIINAYREGEGFLYTTTKSKEEMYQYFFNYGDALFDITYDQLTFNKELKCYEYDHLQFYCLNHKPMNVSYISRDMSLILEFSNHGKTEVTMPGSTKVEYEFNAKYTVIEGLTIQNVYSYVYSIINDLGLPSTTQVTIDESNIKIVYSDYPNSSVNAYLSSLLSKPIKQNMYITNAHDEAYKLTEVNYSMGYSEFYVYTKLDEDLNDLFMTLVNDVQNKNHEYAIEMNIGEGEEPNYSYPLLFWHTYDEELCTFEKYELGEAGEYLFSLFYFFEDNFRIDDYIENNTFYFPEFGVVDLNGNGVIDNFERKNTEKLICFFCSYINNINPGIILEKN